MNGSSGGGGGGEGEWELRPGGMLVQKRTDSDQNRVPPPTIRVRVKYGSNYHEVNISSQSTFGMKTTPFILQLIFALQREVFHNFGRCKYCLIRLD